VPGLVDCHTHLIFAGWRADEFERRCRGETYSQIARAGGGILRTVRDTRAASEAELFAVGRARIEAMLTLGVTTIEAKSGYGLDGESELKILRVLRDLNAAVPVRIASTCLAAHVVPPEFAGRRAEYAAWIADDLLPHVAGERLAEFCDVFVEEGAFTPDDARTIFSSARRLGMGLKLHADQLTDSGGAALAAEMGAVSADHLEFTSIEGIQAMAQAGVAAVALPLASLYLRVSPMNARPFLDAGVPVAVATDFNPGSAPSYHLPLAMTLACTMNGMTPGEVVRGATIHAARAIRREHVVGSIEPGKRADFVLLDAPSLAHWLYHFRPNITRSVFVDGRIAWEGRSAESEGRPSQAK
jgi:imidazolonepropionase